MQDTAVARLADRYGGPKRSRSRRAVLVVVAVVVVLGLVWVVWAGLQQASPKVSSTDVAFNTVDSSLTRVSYRVTKDPQSTAQCAVRVLNISFAIVGWKVDTIGPSAAATTSHTTAVRTESAGVNGSVDSCWIVPSR